MARVCHYHRNRDAVNSCAQCGFPICSYCIQLVGVIPACSHCAPEIYARQQQAAALDVSQGTASMESGAYPPQPNISQNVGHQAAPPNFGPPPIYGPMPRYGAPTNIPPPPTYVPIQQQPIGNVRMGLLAGLIIGIISSIIVMKILFYGQIELSLLFVGVGYGIGLGIQRFTGRGSAGLGTAAVGIMIISLLIGHLIYANDLLQALIASGHALPKTSLPAILPIVASSLGPMHWICIAISLCYCWRIANS